MLKIISVYRSKLTESEKERGTFSPVDMSLGRWIKISEALAGRGYKVDLGIPDDALSLHTNGFVNNGKLRMIPLSEIKWKEYDVVKTVFHRGFETLEKYGGLDHPFIISKLGSVVGNVEMEGIYFYGDVHRKLFETQEKINKTSRYITVLSKKAKELWQSIYGKRNNLLLVPGGVDSDIPPLGTNPYPSDDKTICVFAGNIYDRLSQPEANEVLVNKLNVLGKLLSLQGAKLYLIGPGDTTKLDSSYVTYLGEVPLPECWDYFYYANIGIVVSAGKFMHNNESTKIYHYIRAGLPVVSESGFPNDDVVRESKLGFVTDNGDMELMAKNIIRAAASEWNKDYAKEYIIKNHSWDKRVEVYDRLFKDYLHSKKIKVVNKII